MDNSILKGLPKQSSENEEQYRQRVFEEMEETRKPKHDTEPEHHAAHHKKAATHRRKHGG